VLERRDVVVDEAGAHQEVFRRVAGNGQLWKSNDVGTLLAGVPPPLEDLGNVAIEVADGGVDLGEGDAKLSDAGVPP
jgi:hypothetical protein